MNDEQTSTRVAEPPVEKNVAAVRDDIAGGNGNKPSVVKAEVRRQGPPKTIIREYFESAVVTVIMALFGMTFIVQAVKVPTGSMQNTIIVGDHLLVNKFIFAPGPPLPFLPQREIKRGDIIVFKYPGNERDRSGDMRPDNTPYKTNYVKRVIGLPGDRLEVRGDRVFINDKELPEQRIAAVNENDKAPLVTNEIPPRTPAEQYTVYYYTHTIEAARAGIDQENPSFHFGVNGEAVAVPEGHYFVMGDNRDNSTDSRAWGFVPRELVVGRAMFVYWSYDESAEGDLLPSGFFTNTRWRRTGTMVK